MYKYITAVLIFVLSGASGLQAQELMARVRVDDSQIQTNERRVFRDMETAFTRFLNERKWTDDEFGYNEKIQVNVQVVLKSTEVGIYSGTLIIQSARPVYNTSYITNTFFFRDDDFGFQYVESQPLDFNLNNFNSNLTSVLAFYANIILGMDYDSFERLGGSPFFERAESIAQIARQAAGSAGWDASAGGSASRNRAALIQNIMNNQLKPVRDLMYDYHRLGLDTFGVDADKSREVVLAGLQKLTEVRRYNPSSILLISFLDAKDDELTNMFTKGDISVRRKAYELLSAMDPGKAENYRKMIN